MGTKFSGLNIQLFATTLNETAKQDKYSTNIKVAYDQTQDEEKNRLLSYYMKNSNKNHDRFVFYVGGKLVGKKQAEETISDDGTNVTISKKKGVSIKNYVKNVYVTPTISDCPIWRSKEDDMYTDLSIEGELIRSQASAVARISIEKMLDPLATLAKLAKGATRKISLGQKNGVREVVLPTENQFGDKTKSFLEVEEDFFNMLATMESKSTGNGMESEVVLLFGTAGNSVLKQYNRTSNKEFITTSDFEAKNGKKFAIKKFDVAEMVNIKLFDELIGKNYVIGLLMGAMGYDQKGEPEAITSESEDKENNYYNLKVRDMATVVDIEGIFILDYNGKYKTTGA